MAFRAYHKETTRYLAFHRGVKTNKECFETASAAKAAITREAKRGVIKAEDFGVLSVEEFAKIEKTEKVKNLMTGSEVEQSVNTPHCCDVSSETYWSM